MAATGGKPALTHPLLAPTASPGAAPGSLAKTSANPSGIPSTLSATCTTFVGAGRAITGFSCIVAPLTTVGMFFLDVPPSAALVCRLLGVRELVIGSLTLVTARRQAAAARAGAAEGAVKETAHLRTVLWANIINDAEDVVICLFGVMAGSLKWEPALAFGGGAALLVALGDMALWGL